MTIQTGRSMTVAELFELGEPVKKYHRRTPMPESWVVMACHDGQWKLWNVLYASLEAAQQFADNLHEYWGERRVYRIAGDQE